MMALDEGQELGKFERCHDDSNERLRPVVER